MCLEVTCSSIFPWKASVGLKEVPSFVEAATKNQAHDLHPVPHMRAR